MSASTETYTTGVRYSYGACAYCGRDLDRHYVCEAYEEFYGEE